MKDIQKKSKVAKILEIAISEDRKAQLIKRYEKCPASSGRTKYLKYLNSGKLTYKEATLATCFECCCGYEDGREDCETPTCPLYPFMPYRIT